MIENYVVIDLEMTGLNPKTDVILETGAVRIREGKVADTHTAILRVDRPLPEKIVELTGITEEMTANGREPKEVMQEFFSFVGEDILVGQNIIFDYSFLKQWAVNHKISFERNAVDTLKLARQFMSKEEKKNLESLCCYFGVTRRNAHRALDDALETWQIFERLKQTYGIENEIAFTPKPLLYKTKKQTPATERQKKYLRRYAGYFDIALPADMERMTRSEASRLTDQWIAQYGKMCSEESQCTVH